MGKLIHLIVISVPLVAQRVPVTMDDGTTAGLTISDVQISSVDGASSSLRFSAKLESVNGWDDLSLRVWFRCAGESKPRWAWYEVGAFRAGESRNLNGIAGQDRDFGLPVCANPEFTEIGDFYSIGDAPYREAKKLRELQMADAAEAERRAAAFAAQQVELARQAEREAERRAEEKAQAAKRSVEEAARRAAIAKENARLAKMPSVVSGTSGVFVAADTACARDYAVAMNAGGIEGRKKLADLLTYQCGKIADSGFHVTVIRRQSPYAQVHIENGTLSGSVGWVSEAWLQNPR